jgi:hypothetical protein
MVYDAIYTTYDHCVDKTLDWSICDKTMDDALVEARKAEPITFAVVALIPILALWVVGYFIASIRRGFQPADGVRQTFRFRRMGRLYQSRQGVAQTPGHSREP